MKRLLAYLFIVLGLGLTFSVNANAGIKILGQCVEGDCTNSVGKYIDQAGNIHTGRFINNKLVAGKREVTTGKYKGSVYVGKFVGYGNLVYGYSKIIQKLNSGDTSVHEEYVSKARVISLKNKNAFKIEVDNKIKELYSIDVDKTQYACLVRGKYVKENFAIKIVDLIKTQELDTCEHKIYPNTDRNLYEKLKNVKLDIISEAEVNKIISSTKKTQIAKAEPAKKKKIVKKEQPKKKKKKVKKEITNVSNSQKIKKIIKIDNKEPIKENISLWEKNVLAALEREKNDPYCEIVDKKTFEKLFKKKKGKKIVLNFCIKKSDLLKLGEYKKFNPPTFILDDLKGCKSSACVDKKAGKKVYELFVRRGSQYHARHPGDMIKGMVWFEILYQAKLKKAQKVLKMNQENNYKDFMALKKKDHEKQIYSLIKLNKGRLKMRKALGFSLYDDLYEVIEGQWLLAEFLNKDKLKVSKIKLTPEMFKRKILIEKYKTVLAKYQKKLEEEKQKKIK